LFSETF